MKNNIVIDRLMESPNIKNLGLKRETIIDILNSYSTSALNILLENGHIELDNGMIIEIVQLIDRVHVLRGIPYKGSRKYKLKLTMEDILYKRIEEYYNTLEEEIK